MVMSMLQTQSGQLKLLIVEDDKILLTMMSGALTSEGFNVLAASDAQSAMQYFDKARPDVVILDIDLGAGPSGIDLANKMRQISGRPGSRQLRTTQPDVSGIQGLSGCRGPWLGMTMMTTASPETFGIRWILGKRMVYGIWRPGSNNTWGMTGCPMRRLAQGGKGVERFKLAGR
jgi:CheY-like chemotaxis protein